MVLSRGITTNDLFRGDKMKTFKLILSVFAVFLFGSNLLSKSEWTVMVYIQARNNLESFAKKNLDDMASASIGNKSNILIQWDQPRKRGEWRYKVSEGKIVPISGTKEENTRNPGKKFSDFINWGADNFPANKYGVVFWDHGVGILDPIWGSQSRFLINMDETSNNPRIHIDGITEVHKAQNESELENEISEIKKNHTGFESERGILFDEENKTYMTNMDIQQSLKSFSSKIDKKIDFVGMDACFMAMLEQADLISDYADYLVASEDIELAKGWDWRSFVKSLQNPSIRPVDLAKSVVNDYKKVYAGKTRLFTLSAIDLKELKGLTKNLDDISKQLCTTCFARPFGETIQNLVSKARVNSLEFSTPVYIDLNSFFEGLYSQLAPGFSPTKPTCQHALGRLKRRRYRGENLPDDTLNAPEIVELRNLVRQGMDTLNNKVILARTESEYLNRARGLSIYFPKYSVDNSYFKTPFSKQNFWATFINKFISG